MTQIHFVTPASGIKIRFIGTIDLGKFYKYIKLYLQDKDFAKETSMEKEYIERVKPNGKQIEAIWECSKTINDYIKYKIKVSYLMVGVSEVEVQKENLKLKLYKGDFQVIIAASVEEGSKEWDNLGVIAKLYKKLIAKKRIEDYKNDLYTEILKLSKYIKGFLELRS